MFKYKKKPVQIEAVQFKTGWVQLISDWIGSAGKYDTDREVFLIETLEGTMTATKGDYIIKGIKGEFYPCKADIFEATYEDA